MPGLERHIRLYRNGRDLTATPRDVMVIDLFGLTAEEVRSAFPGGLPVGLRAVKPERDQDIPRTVPATRDTGGCSANRAQDLRRLLAGLPRYIATVETAKHRFFVFLDAPSCRTTCWSTSRWTTPTSGRALQPHPCDLGAGGRRHAWESATIRATTRPAASRRSPSPPPRRAARPASATSPRQLDAHRKRQQAQHPELTLTDMYNVLEKLRAGEP